MSSDNTELAVKVENLRKTFKLPHEKYSSLKQTALHFGKQRYDNLEVLKGISLEIKRGEFFGVVGRNGSGKSTLLKLLAGIYQPTSGSVQINGNLTPFIELGIGFNSELSGRDNVFFNGAILGLTTKEIEEKYDEIVEFSELEQFMDQKIKNYSSGMQVRLAFSIAIQAHNSILLIDEVLAVGDANFARKCLNVFKKIKKSDKTVIFVSHDMGSVVEFCDRAILIDKGEIVAEGRPQYVADRYNELNLRGSEGRLDRLNRTDAEKAHMQRWGNGSAKILSVETFNPDTKTTQNTFTNKERIGVRYTIEALKDLVSPTVGLVFQDINDAIIFATNTPSMKVKLKDLEKGQKVEVSFEVDNIFTDGAYTISGAVASKDRKIVYDRVEKIHEFEIGGWKMPNSVTHPDHKIAVKY